MPVRSLFRFVCAACLLLLAAAAPAQDLAGAKDHPAIKRFAGSSIIGYDQKRFDRYVLQTGPFKRYDARAGLPEYAQSLDLEGAVTRIWYESPGATTATELLRNYVNELVASGFEVLYDASKDGSIRAVPAYLVRFGGDPVRTNRTKYVFSAANQEGTRFASLKLSRPPATCTSASRRSSGRRRTRATRRRRPRTRPSRSSRWPRCSSRW